MSTHPSLNNVGNCTGMHYCEALHLLTISSDQAVEVWDTSVWYARRSPAHAVLLIGTHSVCSMWCASRGVQCVPTTGDSSGWAS